MAYHKHKDAGEDKQSRLDVLICKPQQASLEEHTINFHLRLGDDINREFLVIAFLMSDNTAASV